jgi:hypothetical protein
MSERVVDPDTGRQVELFNSEELKSDRSTYWAVRCEHPQIELGRVVYPNASIHIRKVCLSCGEFVGDTVKKGPQHDQLPPIEYIDIRDKYRKARDAGWKEILQKHARLQRKRDAGFQKEYAAYLSSKNWKEKRQKVLARAKFICEGCLEKPAAVIHHTSYARIYRELLFDLVALCHDCHAVCHPDKAELSDEEIFIGDLPCYGCRQHGENDEGSWCHKFDVHTVIALMDKDLCGPRASALDPLK